MAEDTNTNANRAEAERRLNTRINFLEQGVASLGIGASIGRTALKASLRTALPLVEVYSGLRVDDIQVEDDDDESENIAGLTPKQMKVVNAAVFKATTELLEITSITHPAYPGAQPYVATNIEGQRQVPHLMHLASLYKAGQGMFGVENPEHPAPRPEPEKPDEAFVAEDNRGVAYLAVAPGEYQPTRGPLEPVEIRRSAMRLRSYSTPEPAIMSNNAQPISQPLMVNGGSQRAALMPLSAANAPQASVIAPMSSAQRGARTVARNSGCGCGCSSPSSCGCGHNERRAFSPARYNEDGSCASVFDISCETKWRVRECFKIAFCDMLRCFAEEICNDNEEEPGTNVRESDCGEVFLCSLMRCLPDAICPPEQPDCCHPAHDHDCSCNFAVGE